MAKKKRAFNPNPGPGAEYAFELMASAFERKHGHLSEQAKHDLRYAMRQAFLMAAHFVDMKSQAGRVQGGQKRGDLVSQKAKERREKMVDAYKSLTGMDRECERVKVVAKQFGVHSNTVRTAIRTLL
jgi:hypothetical protein